MHAARNVSSDWNVVITLAEPTFRDARRLLGKWGKVTRTNFFNVLAMTVAEPKAFLADFAAAVAATPGLLNFVSHVIPAQRTIDFHDEGEFAAKAREVALGWLPELAGASFHVRLHRRGLKGSLWSPHEERLLDDALLTALAAAGTPGRIVFDDPDFVIQIETINNRAGISLWTREDLRRFPFFGTE